MLINKSNILLSSFVSSLFLVTYFFSISPNDESVRLWTRYSAHLSFIYLLVAYSAGILSQNFKYPITKQLLKNRRYFGLGFSVTHTFHLVALIYFFYIRNEEPTIVTILGGGLGYLLMYAMAITSTDEMVKMVGIKRWKLIHTIGINYLVVIFFYAFVGAIYQTSIYSIYTIYVLAILIVWGLKISNMVKQSV